MTKRPRSVTVISSIFIAFGGIALLTSLLPKLPGAEANIAEFRSQHPVQYVMTCLGPILAFVCGIFMLRGCNWARWVLVVWFGNNVVSSVFHSPLRFLLPGLLFAVAIYFLFRPQSTKFFRRECPAPPQIPNSDNAPVA